MAKQIKRILRVYFDLTHYVKPKEVNKLFRLMDKRQELIHKIKHATTFKNTDAWVVEQAEVDKDIDLTAAVISPEDSTWGIAKTTSRDETFWMLTISELVQESIFEGGQDGS